MSNIIYTDIHGKSHTVVRKEKTEKPKKTKAKKKSGGLFGKITKSIKKVSTKRANRTSRRIWRKLI